MGAIAQLLAALKEKLTRGTKGAVFDEYVDAVPEAQNAIDALAGWRVAFPPEFGVTAGSEPFDDARLRFAMARFGSLAGARVLELGAFDAAHSAMLEWDGASVECVEPDRLAYMRALVGKETLGLARTRLRLGDPLEHLARADARYDFIVVWRQPSAAQDIERLAALLCARSDAVCLHDDRPETAAAVGAALAARAYAVETADETLGPGTTIFARRRP